MSHRDEDKEWAEKYKHRLNTPKEKWIKYEGPEKLWEMLMEKKKEKGLKIKDEK